MTALKVIASIYAPAQMPQAASSRKLQPDHVSATWPRLQPLGRSQAPAHGSVQPEKGSSSNAKAQRCQVARISVPGQLRQAQRQNHGRTESCNERKSLGKSP